MKQTARIISVYASDTSGVCSALYELGGMTVVHDASGCNSTYATHDEPRWYHSDSMIYISALTEMDAVMGNDAKLVGDVVETARELSPKFIALCGAPIPMMVGTDFDALAQEIEQECGIPTFGFHTNGMHSYLTGAAEAFDRLGERFLQEEMVKTPHLSVGILGATPLDFSLNGSIDSMVELFRENGIETVSRIAMGGSLSDFSELGKTRVNLVVSQAGLALAEQMFRRFQTPFVAGVPVGKGFSRELLKELRLSADDGQCRFPCAVRNANAAPDTPAAVIAGESVFAGSLARAWSDQYGSAFPVRVLAPLEHDPRLAAETDRDIPDEEDAEREFSRASEIIADPMYQPVAPENVPFHPLPHEAFSGRCYHKWNRNLIGRDPQWKENPSC